MSIDIGNGTNVLSMVLIDLHTGKETTLFEREGSKCHFYEDIYFEDYIIILRIDWSDIGNADPVLDADIYQNIAGRKGKKLRNGPWHHTLKEFDETENKKIYAFSFNQLTIKLSAKMTCTKTFTADAILVK